MYTEIKKSHRVSQLAWALICPLECSQCLIKELEIPKWSSDLIKFKVNKKRRAEGNRLIYVELSSSVMRTYVLISRQNGILINIW